MVARGMPSLVGREVDVRVLVPVLEGVRLRGLDPAQLVAGTECSVEQLTTPHERISWSAFEVMMSNLGSLLPENEIVALGSAAMDSPFLRALMLPARVLFGIEEIYRWAFGPEGPGTQLIAVNHGRVVHVEPGHLRVEARMAPGYAPSRVNYLLLRGSLLGIARISRERVEVELALRPDGADYDVHTTKSAGLVSIARRAIARLAQRIDDRRELTTRYAQLEREIVTRINVESELRRSEERYRDLFESAPLPIWVFDIETHRFLAVNRAAVRVYGYSEDELATMRIEDIRPQEDVPSLHEHLARMYSGSPSFRDDTRTWRHRKKDGTIMYVQIFGRDLVFEGRRARLIHVFDLTQRILLEEQLRQAQKMEAIGQLAGGVAHDFNNLLMVISSYTELLMRDIAEPAKRADLGAIRTAAERGADLTQKLLAFARRKRIEPQVLELGQVVAEMCVLLRPVLDGAQQLELDIAEPCGRVRVDRGGIEQILMNLVVNARDATPEGGTIAVSVHDRDLDRAYARANVGVEPGRYVALVVRDSGVGMDAATRARIFEPFYTTKEVGKGTGLGLSTVLGIVQQNGGHVQVDSEPGRGTTIAIYFPRVG